jgi:acetyl-CoA carboxylase carboxyl transferase subunit alpha
MAISINFYMSQNPQLSAIERVRIARHPERPYTLDLLQTIFTEFIELHGDRRFADDPALVCRTTERP